MNNEKSEERLFSALSCTLMHENTHGRNIEGSNSLAKVREKAEAKSGGEFLVTVAGTFKDCYLL